MADAVGRVSAGRAIPESRLPVMNEAAVTSSTGTPAQKHWFVVLVSQGISVRQPPNPASGITFSADVAVALSEDEVEWQCRKGRHCGSGSLSRARVGSSKTYHWY